MCAVVNCFQNCILAYNSQLSGQLIVQVLVVNCFQNCILAYNSQRFGMLATDAFGCELLSKLYFSL